eukprot:CAMPEP_0198496736 /NCGR_PEP_ID=MMETSP1462-20131121/6026_1 /TAXON_ID=1333877 /ORGANISM="Brandtodinium nutriculum, Strain RCC3387" /LENGTH=154 /DNA_ID=CAMNT_0044225581 /DNA_START=83 /DNA_END=545 /DNA_ORIENTATION=+
MAKQGKSKGGNSLSCIGSRMKKKTKTRTQKREEKAQAARAALQKAQSAQCAEGDAKPSESSPGPAPEAMKREWPGREGAADGAAGSRRAALPRSACRAKTVEALHSASTVFEAMRAGHASARRALAFVGAGRVAVAMTRTHADAGASVGVFLRA